MRTSAGSSLQHSPDWIELPNAAYGTYVVFGTNVRCKVAEEVIWDPKKEVKVLVCLTWGFQVLLL